METLQLDYDEGILLQNGEVYWCSRQNLSLTNFTLTNKRIYCQYKKNNGLLKKETEELCVLSLSDIKIINGQALVQQVKYEGTWCLQIQFRQGVECFTFNWFPKKEIPKWIDAINSSLGIAVSSEPPISNSQKSPKKNTSFSESFSSAFAGVAGSLKSAVDTATESFGAQQKLNKDNAVYPTSGVSRDNSGNGFYGTPQQMGYQVSYPVHAERIDEFPSTTVPESKTCFCVNCGAKVNIGAKFCQECGTPTGSINESNTMPGSQRQEVYVGSILKCPGCGAVISETTVVCPECGVKITGRAAVNSVQMFKEQLMAIEKSRKRTISGMLNLSIDSADMQKLSLIRSFPIPNSIDDILEFAFLTIANIDVNLSKNNMMNRYNSSLKTSETSMTIQRTISDAWVAKLQQAYQKAEIMFPSEPVFLSLQKMYFDKMKELKIKIDVNK